MATLKVKASVNVAGLKAGAVGEVEDTPQVRGNIARGFLTVQEGKDGALGDSPPSEASEAPPDAVREDSGQSGGRLRGRKSPEA